MYLATRFSPLVRAVQFCNVYSSGEVEIDVLLPRDISLPKSHDICESIQYSIESLEGITRACESELSSNAGRADQWPEQMYTPTTSKAA